MTIQSGNRYAYAEYLHTRRGNHGYTQEQADGIYMHAQRNSAELPWLWGCMSLSCESGCVCFFCQCATQLLFFWHFLRCKNGTIMFCGSPASHEGQWCRRPCFASVIWAAAFCVAFLGAVMQVQTIKTTPWLQCGACACLQEAWMHGDVSRKPRGI